MLLRRTLVAAMLGSLAACASAPARRRDSSGADLPLSLVNRTTETVCYLYLSAPNQDTWGNDWLGTASIDPGERQTVRLPAGLWDLRTENCLHETTGVLRGARVTRTTTLVLQ